MWNDEGPVGTINYERKRRYYGPPRQFCGELTINHFVLCAVNIIALPKNVHIRHASNINVVDGIQTFSKLC